MTADEFKKQYCDRSGITVEDFDKKLVVLECHFGSPVCKGWAAVQNEPKAIERHNFLCGMEKGNG